MTTDGISLGGGASGVVPKGTLKTLGGMVYQWDGTRYYNTGVRDDNHPLTYEQQLAIATAPRTSSSSNTSSSTSSNYSFQDPRALDLQQQQLDQSTQQAQAAHDLAVKAQNFTEAKYWQDRIDTLAAQQTQIAWQREQLGSQQQFTGGENAANRQATAGLQQGQQAFTGAENALNRAAQAGQFAADYTLRQAQAQQAEQQFAANYQLQLAAQQRADQQAKLDAAKTFSTLSGSADLTGYDRFLAAGGGSLGGAINRGATSLTQPGQLGAARALEAAQSPLPTYGGYTPVAIPGLNQQALNVAPGASQPSTAGGMGQIDPALAGLIPAGTPNAVPMSTDANGTIHYAVNGVPQAPSIQTAPTPQLGAGLVAATPANKATANANMAAAGVPDWVNRFAMGTQPRYAEGTFITGDSTDPVDPAAGGAHPEAVSLQDPPGANNARATVTPLTTPGTGPTEVDAQPMGGGIDPAQLGAVFTAIGALLSGGGGQLGSQLGGGMPRFADGTDPLAAAITPEDQAALDQVMQMRQATQYNVNPYAANYFQSSPTTRAINAAAFQTATGVPGTELDFEANKYQPVGLNRSSEYRTLDIGM